jgi:antirestriction protein ArdC
VGIDYDDIMENSAAYLQGWLKGIKKDKMFIFKTAAAAQKATDYILGK